MAEMFDTDEFKLFNREARQSACVSVRRCRRTLAVTCVGGWVGGWVCGGCWCVFSCLCVRVCVFS